MAAGLERERAKNGKGAAGLGVRKKGLGRSPFAVRGLENSPLAIRHPWLFSSAWEGVPGINEGPPANGQWRMANGE